jgi:hypothetical protein
LLWADKESEQGVLHIEIKLGSDGEQIGLVTMFAGDTSFVDSLTFGNQTGDVSYGRIPDGSDVWDWLTPTPGNANVVLSINDNALLPKTITLHQNYPNPFNPETTLKFDLDTQSNVEIVVSNIMGQAVRSYNFTSMNAGSYNVKFDGQDNFGKQLTSGVYFVAFITPRWSGTQKIVLMK